MHVDKEMGWMLIMRGDACGQGEEMHVDKDMRCMLIWRGDAF